MYLHLVKRRVSYYSAMMNPVVAVKTVKSRRLSCTVASLASLYEMDLDEARKS